MGTTSSTPPVSKHVAADTLSVPTKLGGLSVFDIAFVFVLLLLTYPLFKIAKLPYEFDLAALAQAYWMMPIGAIFIAVLLAAVTDPRQTLRPFLKRVRAQWMLLLLFALAGTLLISLLGVGMGIVILVDTIAFAEFWQRNQEQSLSKLLDVIVPGAYLFLGLIAVFAFNHAIVGIRYGGTFDEVLNEIDHRIFHADVSAIARWDFRTLPAWMIGTLDFAYFTIWSRIGAGFILIAVLLGRMRAIRFVRSLLVCYVIALALFAAFPGKGPYAKRTVKDVVSPAMADSYRTQNVLVSRIHKLYDHTLTADVREVGIGDYYISFPSLHAALPVIMLWSLRRRRRIQLLLLLSYVVFLLPALVLLEWHYFIDIVGGWAVASLAIFIVETAATHAKPKNLLHPPPLTLES